MVRAGEIVARAHNRRELDQDLRHMQSLRPYAPAAQSLGRWRLSDCTVYVTLEPCCMCAGLMVNARVGRACTARPMLKRALWGRCMTSTPICALNHRFNVTAGVLADRVS